MKKHLSVLLGAVVALGLAVGIAPAADAGSYTGNLVTLHTQDVALRSGCIQSHYSLDVPADRADWDADVVITKPDGTVKDTAAFSATSGTPAGYTVLCSTEPRGTYQVTVDYKAYDAEHDVAAQDHVVGSFRFSSIPPVATRLTAKRPKLHPPQWKVVAHQTQAGKPWAHRIVLQAHVGNGWYDVAYGNTGPKGNATLVTKPHRGIRYLLRMHLPATSTTAEANSGTFRLPKR
jgi:hypothetical protein